MDALKDIRKEIDSLDQELIEIFAKRLALVKKVGEIKHQQGLPIYVPEREADMLQARREEAQRKGVPPDLIEDVLRRLMRESYVSENHHGFKTVNPEIKKIVIVGGKGKLAGLFLRYLRLSGYQVEALDSEDWGSAAEILCGADVVIVCVPIAKTLQTIERLQTYLTENMLLNGNRCKKCLRFIVARCSVCTRCSGPILPAWQNKLLCVAMVAIPNVTNGCLNKLKCGGREFIVQMLPNTIKI